MEVVKSITRELRRTPIACLRSLAPLESLIAKKAKMVNPVKAEAAKRESRVEMLTERMRQDKFFVRLVRHTNRAPVTAYRTIAAISTWASGKVSKKLNWGLIDSEFEQK